MQSCARHVVAACAAAVATAHAVAAPPPLSFTTRTVEAADMTITVDQGTISVPETRGDPGSRTIALAFARLRGPASGERAPIVYLPGGPGGHAVSRTDFDEPVARWAPALALTDIIFLDQRGTGRSEPNLFFPSFDPLPDDFFASRDSAIRHAQRIARAAVEHFTQQGIDLTAYHSEASADDVDELRRAMGEEKLSLLGFSYGTHLALATIRRHGEHLDRVVIVGVEGPNHTLKLPSTYTRQIRVISELAAGDPNVNEQVPDMESLLRRVLTKLDAQPMEVVVSTPEGPRAMPVGAFGLQFILRMDIGDGNDFPVFPRLLHSIDQGDPTLLQWFVNKRYPLFARGTSAMSSLFDLASWASADRIERIKAETPDCLIGPVVNMGMLDMHEAWGAPDLGPAYRAPITSDVRLLAISGTLDSNTPPWQAEEVLTGFPNGHHIVVENAGHEDMLFANRELTIAAIRFLAGEDVGDFELALPLPRFVPIEGHDPEITHPSVRSGG